MFKSVPIHSFTFLEQGWFKRFKAQPYALLEFRKRPNLVRYELLNMYEQFELWFILIIDISLNL